MKRICDLPAKVVGEEIFSRIPITSLREVRSTCKLWDSLSREWVLGKAASQFVGFMTLDSKVCSMRFHFRREQDVADVSTKQVDFLSHVEISQVFHCDGLLLCVSEDKSTVLLCNPYLGQTRTISPTSSFRTTDRFALGYDRKNKRTHKILRCGDSYLGGTHQVSDFEIYDLRSNSWKVLDITSEWAMEPYERCASLKGDAYFFAREKMVCTGGRASATDLENFLVCFDFTKERFGPRLPLPFHSEVFETVALSCVGEDRLAVLRQHNHEYPFHPLEIWVTSMVEPEAVSWTMFLKLDKSPVTWFGHLMFSFGAGSFFIDEEQKTAVVFDVEDCEATPLPHSITRPTEPPQHTAYILRDDGYVKFVTLGEAPDLCRYVGPVETYYPTYCPPLVCPSPYLPSLVQINQPNC